MLAQVISDCKFRKDPINTSSKFGSLIVGNMVHKIGESVDFYHVTPGPVGWVKKVNINKTSGKGTLKNRCQFRIEPEGNSAKFGTLDKDDIVQIIGEKDDYYQVNGGNAGWVLKRNIVLLAAPAAPAAPAAAQSQQYAPQRVLEPLSGQLRQGSMVVGRTLLGETTFALMNQDGSPINAIKSGTNLSIIDPNDIININGYPAIYVNIPDYLSIKGYVYIYYIQDIKGLPGNYQLGGAKSKRSKSKRSKSKRSKSKRSKSKRPKSKRSKSKRPKTKRPKSNKRKSKK
jgi:hypothetical protein